MHVATKPRVPRPLTDEEKAVVDARKEAARQKRRAKVGGDASLDQLKDLEKQFSKPDRDRSKPERKSVSSNWERVMA